MARLRSLSPRVRRLVRIVTGAVVLGGILATVGAGPFIRGVASISWPTVAVAVVLTGVATVSAVWRWRSVAAAFGLELSWTGAIAAYYRSQFLNTVLPGGVVGDVHRAYRHGRRAGSVALAARAVATERIAGQLVQFVLVVVVLSVLGLSSPVHAVGWVVGGVVVLVVIAVGITATAARGRQVLRRELGHLGRLFVDARRSMRIVASSIIVVACHTTVFIVACMASGVRAPAPELITLALIALTAAAVPVNLGGWGPREGAAASAFLAVGLGAGAGVAASTTFGVLTTIAVLPGAAVLIVSRIMAAREVRLVGKSASEPFTLPTNEVQPRKEEVTA
jgi:uncharacterized membrane protein YbhN (UPF0104 family)